MNNSVVRRLIAKDLYLYRWLIVGTLLAGLASVFLSGADGAPGQVGQILLVTSIIVLGVFLAIHGFLSERQTRSLLFVLSLPISPLQYTAAKVTACLIAFLIPWTVIFATIVGLTLAFDPPADGALPFTVAMMGLFLANFCILVAIGVITGSETWAIIGIIATNTSVPVLLSTVVPAITEQISGPVAIWSPAILVMLGIEVAVIVLSLGLAFHVQSRRNDFV